MNSAVEWNVKTIRVILQCNFVGVYFVYCSEQTDDDGDDDDDDDDDYCMAEYIHTHEHAVRSLWHIRCACEWFVLMAVNWI